MYYNVYSNTLYVGIISAEIQFWISSHALKVCDKNVSPKMMSQYMLQIKMRRFFVALDIRIG